MSKGFYSWIRDGVRRAVLMGVSDAIDQLGAPEDKQDISPHLLAVLRQDKPLLEGAAAGSNGAGLQPSRGKQDRKRLGKSFGEIARPAAPAT